MASSPPYEDGKSYLPRKSSKVTKPTLSRTSKRTSSSHEHSLALDGRHKRVWKACERCRMKKTKCDGESPCKRCKDDGLLCQAGTRRKTEYKQAPKGYAEVLETSQFALTSTVQRLYRMIRNGETWDLGEPDINERGEPVIHDIVDKLGLLRQPSDLPITFAENEAEMMEVRKSLEEQDLQQSPTALFASAVETTETSANKPNGRKHSQDSMASTPPLKVDRASSVESDASLQLPSYMSTSVASPREVTQSISYNSNSRPKLQAPQPRLPATSLSHLRISSYTSDQTNSTMSLSTPSPSFDTFDSPMLLSEESPFNAWSSNEWLSDSHPLSQTAQILEKPRQAAISKLNPQQISNYARQNFMSGMQYGREAVWQGDGTIRPCDIMDFNMQQQSSQF